MKKIIIVALLVLQTLQSHAEEKTAVFAGGCFWCVEQAYQDLDGVLEAVSGFTGGTLQNPTYSGNHDGHYEAVKVTFDSSIISYDKLLHIFWRNIDPFDNRGQFCDKGFSYRSAIFADDEQREKAESSLKDVAERFSGQTVYTEILPTNKFWPVENYHQDYYKKNPIRYKYYKSRCGRDKRLNQIWGDEAGGY